MRKKPLIVLTGPTAVGKTKLSISLAKVIGGEIISADSMQVYKHMNIGSAKIRPEEMDGVPHFLVDVLEPEEEFHVVRFQEMAKQAMKEIYRHGKVPILVGGTGFYIQAVLYDIDFTQHGEDPAYRRELEALAEEKGSGYLYEMLLRVDPCSAEKIHAHNVKRVIRALEYFQQTKTPLSAHNIQQRQKESPYCSAYFVLQEERQRLYDRINRRVDRMMEEGLLQEVCNLKEQGCTRNMVSMQGLGYKELLDYLDGNCTLEEAVSVIKRDTRHFAKRQITWFKRERDVLWIDKAAYDYDEKRMLLYMLKELEQRKIIPHTCIQNF